MSSSVPVFLSFVFLDNIIHTTQLIIIIHYFHFLNILPEKLRHYWVIIFIVGFYIQGKHNLTFFFLSFLSFFFRICFNSMRIYVQECETAVKAMRARHSLKYFSYSFLRVASLRLVVIPYFHINVVFSGFRRQNGEKVI